MRKLLRYFRRWLFREQSVEIKALQNSIGRLDQKITHLEKVVARNEVASASTDPDQKVSPSPTPTESTDTPPPRATFDGFRVVDLLRSFQGAGLRFAFPDELELRGVDGGGPLVVLKHDIHHNIDRVLKLAKFEHALGISGLYFMMGPHEINRKIYGEESTWSKLREVQSMGHRIGMHIDIVDSIIRRGNLYDEIAENMEKFTKEGLVVRYANAHGNTKLKEFSEYKASDFFQETARPLLDTLGDSALKGHWGRYSLAEIGRRFGIEHWVDAGVYRAGQPLERLLYVTDNPRAFAMPSKKLLSKQFDLDADFERDLVIAVRTERVLMLLHPQWYQFDEDEPKIAAPKRPQQNAERQLPAEKPHFSPIKYDSLDQLTIDAPKAVSDFSIEIDGFRYDARLNARVPGDHLIVALHGGVRGAKALPVLARWTQHAYFKAPILSVFDPLVYKSPDIPGGWYVGDLERDATVRISQLAVKFGDLLGFPPSKIVFIGNSSGAYASVRLAYQVGGRFVSINGQTKIVDYYPSGHGPFSEAFDPSNSPQNNADRHPERWTNIRGLQEALERGVDVRGVLVQNVNDRHHFEQHFQPICEALNIPITGGTDSTGRVLAFPYDGPDGHGPEPSDVARAITKTLIPDLVAR